MARRLTSGSTVRLPGVGERLDARDTSGLPVTVVRRHDGSAQLHVGPAPAAELDARTATEVGAFLSGHYVLDAELAERVDDVLGGLVFDWVRLDTGDHAVGHTIEQLAVRRRTGVTIVAILRGSVPIVAPDPGVRLEAGDELVIAGRDQDRDGFVRYMERGP